MGSLCFFQKKKYLFLFKKTKNGFKITGGLDFF